jgi:hypothetical protein
MSRVRTIVERSEGGIRFIPLSELWEVSGLLADTFPLDREVVTLPRPVRQTAQWTRLLLVDRAVTNREGTAMVTFSETPWVPAVTAAVLAAVVVPKLPGWVRAGFFAAVVARALRGQRLQRYLELRRDLGRVAPDSLLVGDFVARRAGDGMTWVGDMLEALDQVGGQPSYVALLPESNNPRRHRARERLYTTRLGFRVAGRTDVAGGPVTILVRG